MATTHPHLTARGPWAWALAAVIAAVAALLSSAVFVPEATAADSTVPGYGWPVKPFHRQHPVRGFFGDPRIGMTPKGMEESFHFGIDVSCPNGTAVYATLDGVVRLQSFRPETVAVVGYDGRTEFQYWHIVPSVRERAARHRLPHRRRPRGAALGARALRREPRRRVPQPAAPRARSARSPTPRGRGSSSSAPRPAAGRYPPGRPMASSTWSSRRTTRRRSPSPAAGEASR